MIPELGENYKATYKINAQGKWYGEFSITSNSLYDLIEIKGEDGIKRMEAQLNRHNENHPEVAAKKK